ncbi:MAG: hypothetical protein HC895_19245 [Leptolyngbyaceae cyanobacterium SM1_3_5]|nr:hypothetical protein [Leptolyngbyaceae cyanobacterium SM1_3_5]
MNNSPTGCAIDAADSPSVQPPFPLPMLHMIERLFALHKIEYAVIDRDWRIVEFSAHFSQLADAPNEVQIDRDIRLSLPELVGAEAALERILQQQQQHFELRSIARPSHPERPIYINLHVLRYEEDRSCDR